MPRSTLFIGLSAQPVISIHPHSHPKKVDLTEKWDVNWKNAPKSTFPKTEFLSIVKKRLVNSWNATLVCTSLHFIVK